MPQVVPAFQAAAAWIGGTTIGAQIARIALQTLVLRALSKTPKTGAAPINVTLRSTVASRQLIFGQVRAGGAMLDYGTYGAKAKYLVYVVAFAGHQTEDALDGYLDKYKVAAAYINNTTGAVTDPAFDGKLVWHTNRGTQAQTAHSLLTSAFPSVWTTNHRLCGISYDIVQMERSDKAFPNGAPQSVNRVIKGMKLYDPRLDSTRGGAGSHRTTDPSTWAYSRNLALAIRWFLTGGSVVNDQTSCLVMYGLKEDASRIDEAFWIAAANKCDESLSGGNAPPSGAQARYTLDLEVNCEMTRRDIIETMLAAGAGAKVIYVHGKWRLYVGAYDAPVHTFTQDDLHGDLEIADITGAEERFNSISAVYIDAARDYTEQTSKIRTNSAYVTQDGGKDLPREIALRGVTNEYCAQRVTEILLRQARQMRTIKLRFGRQGLVIAPYETFIFDHTRFGWSGRVWRCLEREVVRDEKGAITVLITARAEASSVYDDLLTADYSTGTSVTNALQSEPPDEPTSLVANSIRGAIEFSWSLGTFWEQHGIVEIWEHTSQTPFSSATRIWVGKGTRAVIRKDDATIRYYWVRVTAIGGQVSATEPATNGLPAGAQRDMEMISDPGFELATDDTYWFANANQFFIAPETGVTIVNTGGVAGGVLSLTGDSTQKVVFNKRSTPFPVITGQNMRIRFRWRRTGTVNAANATDVIFQFQLSTTDGDIPTTVRQVAAGPFGGVLGKTRADIAAVNVNEWQEDEFTGVFANVPKSGAQLPYAELIIRMFADCTSGTIEIDQVSAVLI